MYRISPNLRNSPQQVHWPGSFFDRIPMISGGANKHRSDVFLNSPWNVHLLSELIYQIWIRARLFNIKKIHATSYSPLLQRSESSTLRKKHERRLCAPISLDCTDNLKTGLAMLLTPLCSNFGRLHRSDNHLMHGLPTPNLLGHYATTGFHKCHQLGLLIGTNVITMSAKKSFRCII